MKCKYMKSEDEIIDGSLCVSINGDLNFFIDDTLFFKAERVILNFISCGHIRFTGFEFTGFENDGREKYSRKEYNFYLPQRSKK